MNNKKFILDYRLWPIGIKDGYKEYIYCDMKKSVRRDQLSSILQLGLMAVQQKICFKIRVKPYKKYYISFYLESGRDWMNESQILAKDWKSALLKASKLFFCTHEPIIIHNHYMNGIHSVNGFKAIVSTISRKANNILD